MAKLAQDAKEILFSGSMDMEEMKEVLDLYRDLYPITEKAPKPKVKLSPPSPDEAAMRLREGFTLLDPEDLVPAEKALHKKAGEILAVLHKAQIIHGDFTPANLIQEGRKLFVIDFGLGFFSNDIEDKAIDVYTMLKALDEKSGAAFIEGYKTENPKHKTILKRVEDVKKRVRYAQ